MRKQWKGFLAGVLAATLVCALASPALAVLAGKTIQVFTGVNVYVDDQLIQPKDANGNPVEVFVHNGTTYLPIRAIGNALGMPVQWEGKTNSAYVGKHDNTNLGVSLDLSDPVVYRSLNLFLSHFTEGRLLDFSVESPNYKELAHFALYYAFRREPDLVEEIDPSAPLHGGHPGSRVSSANVKNIARQLFSQDLDLSGVERACAAGYSSEEITNGIGTGGIILADSLTNLGNDQFKVDFHRYSTRNSDFCYYNDSLDSAVYSAQPQQFPELWDYWDWYLEEGQFYLGEAGHDTVFADAGEATIEAVLQPDGSVSFLLRSIEIYD